jgi:tripartite-type tricarboxylate transporter receptor subunit TctC
MTGAGGAVAASHIVNNAARDGTVMAAVLPGTITDPLYNGREKARFDPAKLIYLGSANSEINMCYVRADAGVTSVRDLATKEVIIGAGQEGGSTRDQPAVQVNLLGHKLRIVAGYPGSREMFLAMEKNEVSGICGLGLPAFRQQHADWLDSGFVRILTQDNAHGDPRVSAMGVPRTVDLAKTPQDRQAMELIYSQQDFGRPYILPPGVPPERVAALRKAFLQTLADKDLLADAARLKIEITPVAGADLQALVEKIYATPPEVVERARQALTYRP